DVVRDWPAAALALRRVHAAEARQESLPRGSLTLFAARLFLAERDRPRARELLARRYPRSLPWRSDPRGLFLVRLERDRIVVQHGGPVGPSGREWEGASAEQLTQAILNEQLVGLPEHAAYLGRELQRAEVAARLGLPYRQDAPLDWE